jgi:hypothetical protein
MFALLLSHIFNISLFQGKFPTLWKQAVVMPVLKKSNNALLNNYRPIKTFKKFFKILYSKMLYQFSFYFKFKLRQSQSLSVKSKSTVTNLITCLNSVTISVSSQGQTDSIYFDLSHDFDKISHTPLLHKLGNFGLSDRYINWFQSYLSFDFLLFTL